MLNEGACPSEAPHHRSTHHNAGDVSPSLLLRDLSEEPGAVNTTEIHASLETTENITDKNRRPLRGYTLLSCYPKTR
jgi:hypothetical protein